MDRNAPRPTGRHRRSGQLDHVIGIRKEVPPRLRSVLFVLSFVLPLLAWCVIAYVPFFVHYLPPHLTSLPFTGY